MALTISVNRKGEDLFFTMEGDFNDHSSQEVIDALKKLVMTLLKCAAPASQVVYTFKTRSKVDLKEAVRLNQSSSCVAA